MSPIKGSFPSLSSSYSPARMTASYPKMPDIKSLNLDPMPTRYYEEDPNYKQALSTWQAQKPKRADYGSQRSFNITLNAWKKKEPSMYGKFYKPESTYKQEAADWSRAKDDAIQGYMDKYRVKLDPIKKDEINWDAKRAKSLEKQGRGSKVFDPNGKISQEAQAQIGAFTVTVSNKLNKLKDAQYEGERKGATAQQKSAAEAAKRQLDAFYDKGVSALGINFPQGYTGEDISFVNDYVMTQVGKQDVKSRTRIEQGQKEISVYETKDETVQQKEARVNKARTELAELKDRQKDPDRAMRAVSLQSSLLTAEQNRRLSEIEAPLNAALKKINLAEKTPEMQMLNGILEQKIDAVGQIYEEMGKYYAFKRTPEVQERLDRLSDQAVVAFNDLAMASSDVDAALKSELSTNQQDLAGWKMQQRADNPLGANNQFIQEPTVTKPVDAAIIEGLIRKYGGGEMPGLPQMGQQPQAAIPAKPMIGAPDEATQGTRPLMEPAFGTVEDINKDGRIDENEKKITAINDALSRGGYNPSQVKALESQRDVLLRVYKSQMSISKK